MKKKLLAFVLGAAMVFSLTACGGQQSPLPSRTLPLSPPGLNRTPPLPPNRTVHRPTSIQQKLDRNYSPDLLI